ncbi:MAG: response regulator [bacterium]|nr:response regulator [bacterium]MDT8365739.1 response regulator [bacterium]
MNEPKTVLVVDKSEQVREHLLKLLTRYGYKVLETGSSSDAIDILGDGDVDLLLVEVGTRGHVEGTMIAELRSTPPLKDIPVIVLAASEDVGDVANWVSSGCNDFLLKPVNPRLLFQRVQALIEAHPRAYKRAPCNVLAEGTTGSEHVTGELQEVGEGGASLVLDRQLATDDILKLTFKLPRQPGVLTLGAGIIYVQGVKGSYIHGLKFIIIDRETKERIKQFVQDTILQDS